MTIPLPVATLFRAIVLALPFSTATIGTDLAEIRERGELRHLRIKADGTYNRLIDHYCPGIRRYFPEFFARKR
jgi:hypothetical protein